MPSVTLVDGTDLTAWANRRDAQQVLPQLLRRLVHATVGRVIRVGFPAGEGVQLGGWDGVVAVEQGNAFVPDGASAWELSTNQDFRGKADSDYEKRLVDPRGIEPVQSNFVFVTPRRWGRKDEWAAGRRREGVWRDVRAYDADDLEAWLELAPAVHVWISILLGKHPEDALDLRSFWADWSEATRPATTPELILAGRREVVERVHAWLREPPVPLALQAEDRAEALAVFAASIERLPVEERVAHLSRALVVHTLPAWHRLTASPEALILAMVFESSEALARATRGGHRVIIPLGRADSASAATVTVPRLSRDEATTALVALGIPEDRARDLATLARRGIMSFRRRLAVGPEMQQPQWARPEAARSLLPALFAGAWNAANEGDRQAVAALAQVPYEEVTDRFIRWSSEPDPPVRRVGDAWSVTSKEDAWSLLARYLTRDDLERFAGVLLDILGTPDPRFDLPEDQRWMAEARGHSPRHSGLLREGVADTLAVMGTRGDTILLAAGLSARDRADHIARRLLERANGDWRLWASLAHVLPLLAEAAPDAFLDGVEGGLGGAEPVLLRMFARPDGDWVFSSSPHTGLLWALETVAWSPEHLGRVAMVLARLARLDPGGTLANRPQNSLCEIYLLWHPQTTASLEQRLRVLDALRGREPDVAWRLLSQLLPEQHGIAHNTARPRWRDWAPDSLPPVTVGEYWRAVREVVGRMVSDAAESGARWQDLIEALHRLPADLHDTIVDRLMRMDLERLHPADRTSTWADCVSLSHATGPSRTQPGHSHRIASTALRRRGDDSSPKSLPPDIAGFSATTLSCQKVLSKTGTRAKRPSRAHDERRSTPSTRRRGWRVYSTWRGRSSGRTSWVSL